MFTDSSTGSNCQGGQLAWWSSDYDACSKCERLGFNQPLRHWLVRFIGTYSYMWRQMWGFMDLVVGQNCKQGFYHFWKLGKIGRHFSSQGKVREFSNFLKNQGILITQYFLFYTSSCVLGLYPLKCTFETTLASK